MLKNLIREQAEKLDSDLIALLLENGQTRAGFFIKIKDALVFDGKTFKKYLKDGENMAISNSTQKQKEKQVQVQKTPKEAPKKLFDFSEERKKNNRAEYGAVANKKEGIFTVTTVRGTYEIEIPVCR